MQAGKKHKKISIGENRSRRIGGGKACRPVSRVCFVLGVSLASAASLLVAELDLKLVQSVLSAIRTADIESAADKKPPLPIVRNSLPPQGTHVAREGPIERAPHRIPAAIIYTSRRCRPAPVAMPVVVETVVVEKKADDLCSPLQPPWKQLPWNLPPAPSAKIKIVRYQPDICNRGTMLDCFI